MSRKVLVVDDEKHVLGILSSALSPLGCEVQTAADGEQHFF